MGFIDCPYCKKEATSYFNLGNTFYFFRTDKKCEFCKKPIKFDAKALFVFYLVIAPLTLLVSGSIFIFFQVIATNYLDNITRQIIFIIIIVLLLVIAIIMNLLAIKMANKLFRIRMFSPKN